MKWFRSGLLDFVVVVQAQKTYQISRPNKITIPEMVNKIHDIVLNDPNMKVREIAEIVSISTKSVVNSLHKHFCMRKFCARWVPRLLTIDQKCIDVTTAEKNLAYFNRNSKNSGLNLVKVHQNFRKRSNRMEKLWLVFFWDAHGVIFIDCLDKGSTIAGAYYAALLD